MAELMHFQPGKTFYDAYQGARGNTLAQMAFNSQGEERQSALGQLAGLNPDAAFKLKADFDDQDRADLAEFTNVFMTLPDDLKQPAYSKGVQRFGHKFRAMGIEPPADFKQAMPLFEQIAAANGGGQQAPAKVQEAEYFANASGFKKGTPQYNQAIAQYMGVGGNRGKMSIAPDGTPYIAEDYKYWDGNKWIDISPEATGGRMPPPATNPPPTGSVPPPVSSGGKTIVTPQDIQGAAQRTGAVMQQVRAEIAELIAQGVPADQATSQVTQKYAQSRGLTMPSAGQQPAPVQQTAPPIAQTAPPPDATAGQGRGLFAKPKDVAPATWNAPVVETRGGKQVRVRYGTYNGQHIEQVIGDAELTPEAPKPPTADERSARGYLDRMTAAEGELDKLVSEGFTPNVKDFYTAGEGAALNWMATPKGQVWRQQQEDWVRAKLRRESGAAIPPDEMDREIKTYFPQPGDSKDVIEAKKRSRGMARQQFVTMAGSAAPSAPNKPAGGTKPATANPPARNSKGWVLEEDKNGKKAYVSPDRKQYEAIP